MFRMTRFIFYPYQLPPTLHARRFTSSACGVYDLTIFWFIGARKPFMNDSSSSESFNARIRGALLLASFLDKCVASPSVHFSSYIDITPFSSFLYFNLADFSRENSSPLLLIDPSAVVNTIISKAVLFLQDLFTCKFFFSFSLHFYFA